MVIEGESVRHRGQAGDSCATRNPGVQKIRLAGFAAMAFTANLYIDLETQLSSEIRRRCL